MSVKNSVTSSKGFTLIEMVIVILIIGIGLAAASTPYRLYLERTAIEKTNDNIAAINAAIGKYRLLNGRYPCPASNNALRDNPLYGHTASECLTPVIPVGTCDAAKGLCVYASARGVTTYKSTDPALPAVNETPLVAVGAVPFRELNLLESQAYDGYNNRISYAVTERLATLNYFVPDGGGIEVLNNTGTQSAIAAANTAHYVVLSGGKNGFGVYSRYGVLANNCPGAGPEMENCDGDATFQSAQSSSQANTFDDVMVYFTQEDLPYWQYSTLNPNHIHEKPGGNVGASTNTETTLTGAKFHVGEAARSGAARISGDLMAEQICDQNGATGPGDVCFDTKLLAGSLTNGDGIQCPPNQFLKKIHDNTWECTPTLSIKCPAGKRMTGIKIDGTPNCGVPVCPPGNIQTGTNPDGSPICEAPSCPPDKIHVGNNPDGTWICEDEPPPPPCYDTTHYGTVMCGCGCITPCTNELLDACWNAYCSMQPAGSCL